MAYDEAQVKKDIVKVFEQLGGHHSLLAWARENRDEFYRLALPMLTDKGCRCDED